MFSLASTVQIPPNPNVSALGAKSSICLPRTRVEPNLSAGHPDDALEGTLVSPKQSAPLM